MRRVPLVDMMPIAFLHPLFLVSIAAIPLIWVWPRGRADRVQRALRSLVLLAVVAALARPVLFIADRDTYVVVIVDDSPSVGAPQARQRDAAVRQLLDRPGRRDRRFLVAIGREPRPSSSPWDAAAFGATIAIEDRDSRSPLSDALAAALRQIPHGARGAIHLFTDGLATDRRWAPEMQQIIERGIAVHAYDLQADAGDVYPVAVKVDDVLRVGQTARVEVDVVGAARGLQVRLVDAAGEEIALSPIVDSDGRTTVPVTFEPKRAGFLDLTAQILVTPDRDSDRRNNALRRAVAVQDPLRVLYLGDRQQHAAARISALLGRGFDLTDAGDGRLTSANLENVGVDSGGVSGRSVDLRAFDLVLLDDRPASKVPAVLQQQLTDAVRHQGLGLVLSGGRAMFGTGGYDGTPIASIAPVEFVQRTERRDPSTALALIIDTSGSMIGSRIELAKQVARLAVRRLHAHDRIGIVEFYGNKHWALPLQSAANKIAIDRAIGRMQAVGGTVLTPAIEEAYYGLKNVDTRYKHILIVTDAGIEESNYEALIRLITKDGVNVSTVLVGAQAHSQMMIDMASWGRGRYYSAVDRYSLPEVILKQPSTMKLPAYRRGTFGVRGRGGVGWWSDIDRGALPGLDGYVETRTRPGSEVLMEIEDTGHPLLATWRYGLGRVTALMTEPSGEGTHGWRGWDDYGRLLARVFSRTADDSRLFQYEISRDDRVVTVTATRNSRDSTLVPRATLVDAQGRATTALRFRQRAPGLFSATTDADPRAAVRVVAAAAHRESAPGQTTRLVSTAGDGIAEEHQVDPERGLDLAAVARATGGRYTDAAALAAGVPREVSEASDETRAADEGPAPRTAIGLWPWLLSIALLLYLGELIYRRWPHAAPGSLPRPTP